MDRILGGCDTKLRKHFCQIVIVEKGGEKALAFELAHLKSPWSGPALVPTACEGLVMDLPCLEVREAKSRQPALRAGAPCMVGQG